MALTSTRTHTRYFDDERLAPLRKALDDLAADWNDRVRPFSDELRAAGDRRIAVAEAAYSLLAEPVSEALY